MNAMSEPLAATTKDKLETLQGYASKTQADAAKLTKFHLTTSTDVWCDSVEHAKAMLVAKDTAAFFALQKSLAIPLTEKSTAYVQQIQALVASASTEFAKGAKANLTESQQSLATFMACWAKDATARTESALALFNNNMNAFQNALKSVQATARQAVDTAQSRLAMVSAPDIDADGKVSLKA